MDRSAVKLIALREITTRGRDRAFLISTVVTLGILLAVIIIGSFNEGVDKFKVGVVGGDARAIVADAIEGQDQFNAELEERVFPTEEAAKSALEDGEVNVVLIGSERLLSNQEPEAGLQTLLSVAHQRFSVRAELEGEGLGEDEIAGILDPPALAVEMLDPPDPEQEDNKGIAFIGIFLLYGQILGYGVWIAMGVVEEKQSRVVELLLATVRPAELLAGKVIGIGALGLAQLIGMGVVAAVAAQFTGAFNPTASAWLTIGNVVLWFILGYAFYSCVFAAAGARVSRQEEVQNTVSPLSMIMLAAFFVAIFSQSDPDTTVATIASLIPASAPLVMPLRIAAGSAPGWQIVLSFGLTAGATLLMIPLAGRVYRGAVLRTGGTVKWKDAFRARVEGSAS